VKAHHPAAGAGLRTLFLGNDPWSVPPMEALAASRHHVVRVFTGVAKPAGRGSKLTPTAVATAARELELPLLEVGTVRSGWALDALQDAEADVLVVVAYGEILTAEVLEVARLGSVNVHFSLLPALRGASPVRHALLLGLSETGVTTMRMDEGLDTGPILLQAREPVRGEDDAGSLGARLAAIGGRLLVDTLDRLATGTLHPRAQDGAGASWAPKLAAQDRVLDWGQDAVALVLPLVHHLKAAGIPVETDYTGASLKSQMKKADKSGAGHTLIIGEQEMKSGMAVLRNMQTKEQEEIALRNIEEELKKRTARAS